MPRKKTLTMLKPATRSLVVAGQRKQDMKSTALGRSIRKASAEHTRMRRRKFGLRGAKSAWTPETNVPITKPKM